MSQSIDFRLPGSHLTTAFDGPQLTSDGGLCWLSEADSALGLCATLAQHVPEWRRRAGRHSLENLVRQRVFQIACGYEDQNDADSLRYDPLLKLVCGRLPDGADLASQPTLFRLDNAAGPRACYRLAVALVRLYLEERGREGMPDRIVLDFDGTDDPASQRVPEQSSARGSHQEGVAYHGYYAQHMLHPLLVFDGETGHLITAILRPGTVHASRGALAVLKRLVRHIRARWPHIPIEFRADSGFAIPALYDYLEDQHITYTIGLATNDRLNAVSASLAAQARRHRQTTGEKIRLFDDVSYRAGTWRQERRVIIKAEALEQGLNVRFVVTSRTDAPEDLYGWYTRRGDHPELCIKDLKEDCFADRLSCHRFWANQFRLLLHSAAYWLLDTIRRWLARLHMPHLQLGTLRLRLIKIGGWIRQRLEHDVHMYRISSDVAPYYTDTSRPEFSRQLEECRAELLVLGEQARRFDIRLSTHPGQYVVLNSPSETVYRAAVRDVEYHTELLDLMEQPDCARIVVHVGGVYGDRPAAAARFAQRYADLSERVRARLVIENDDQSWPAADVLTISRETGVPVVFDVLHHAVLNPEGWSGAEALETALATWPADQVPKVHYSDERTEPREVRRGGQIVLAAPRKGQHADYIEAGAFLDFIERTSDLRPFDVMLETKAKDLALFRLRADLESMGAHPEAA